MLLVFLLFGLFVCYLFLCSFLVCLRIRLFFLFVFVFLPTYLFICLFVFWLSVYLLVCLAYSLRGLF